MTCIHIIHNGAWKLGDFIIKLNRYIIDKKFLSQIQMINEDFRKKAAHPYVLSAEVAEHCRDCVRACLNEFILNYKEVICE